MAAAAGNKPKEWLASGEKRRFSIVMNNGSQLKDKGEYQQPSSAWRAAVSMAKRRQIQRDEIKLSS